CYFALDRLLALDARDDAGVDLRPVRPGVLRLPERYQDRDALEQQYFERDTHRTAAFLGLPYGVPDPSPVAFEDGAWVAKAEQPRIGMLYDLLMAAASFGRALAFLD
ncbi:MAG: 2-hydroxychromene-2-carboxylate isomerase, partial [Xanthomonadales bacterium]|nr:2-hydroxychromene-2-carboxylate isomerase [Xanthomonadales bacterium]